LETMRAIRPSGRSSAEWTLGSSISRERWRDSVLAPGKRRPARLIGGRGQTGNTSLKSCPRGWWSRGRPGFHRSLSRTGIENYHSHRFPSGKNGADHSCANVRRDRGAAGPGQLLSRKGRAARKLNGMNALELNFRTTQPTGSVRLNVFGACFQRWRDYIAPVVPTIPLEAD